MEKEMSEFKYIKGPEDNIHIYELYLVEIAYQLKRIADNMEESNGRNKSN